MLVWYIKCEGWGCLYVMTGFFTLPMNILLFIFYGLAHRSPSCLIVLDLILIIIIGISIFFFLFPSFLQPLDFKIIKWWFLVPFVFSITSLIGTFSELIKI